MLPSYERENIEIDGKKYEVRLGYNETDGWFAQLEEETDSILDDIGHVGYDDHNDKE